MFEIGPGVGRLVGSRSCVPDPRALEEILEESTYNTPYAIIKLQEHRVNFSSLHDLVPRLSDWSHEYAL